MGLILKSMKKLSKCFKKTIGTPDSTDPFFKKIRGQKRQIPCRKFYPWFVQHFCHFSFLLFFFHECLKKISKGTRDCLKYISSSLRDMGEKQKNDPHHPCITHPSIIISPLRRLMGRPIAGLRSWFVDKQLRRQSIWIHLSLIFPWKTKNALTFWLRAHIAK